MSDVADRLAEIRERVEAATEGPWTVYENRHLLKVRHSDDAATNGQVCKVAEFPIEWQRKNAQMIAASRSDVPYLLSLVEEVVDLLDGWERAYPTDIFPEPPERPDEARLVWVDPDTGEKLSETFALGRVSAAMGRFMAAALRRALRDVAQEGEG